MIGIGALKCKMFGHLFELVNWHVLKVCGRCGEFEEINDAATLRGRKIVGGSEREGEGSTHGAV